MSRAFVKEGDGPERPRLPELALPPGAPNLITPAGRNAFVARRDGLREERATLGDSGIDAARRVVLDETLRWFDARLATFVVHAPPTAPDRVVFGCEVALDGDPPRRFRIVGVDEADPDAGSVSWQSPVAQAVLGKRPGDEVTIRTPAGDEHVEIVEIVA